MDLALGKDWGKNKQIKSIHSREILSESFFESINSSQLKSRDIDTLWDLAVL